MTKIRAKISGVNGWVPDYVLTNKELETIVDTTDDWITSRTGIKERRILKGEGQGTSVIGIEAVKGLLAKTNTDPADIDKDGQSAELQIGDDLGNDEFHCHIIAFTVDRMVNVVVIESVDDDYMQHEVDSLTRENAWSLKRE